MDAGEQPASTASPPDWDAIESDFFCPLCDYNLRGLADPRCPECGFRFDWPDVLDPSRRVHPYIFEHHPERNFRSFWRTAFAGWRPRRFWKSLHPARPARPRRLILYWCLAASAVLLAHAVIVAAYTYKTTRFMGWGAATHFPVFSIPSLTDSEGYRPFETDSYYRDPDIPLQLSDYVARVKAIVAAPTVFGNFLFEPACALCWAWLTLLVLLVFQVSMRRAKVKLIQVLRCVVYSADFILWLGIIRLVLTPIHFWVLEWWRPWLDFEHFIFLLVFVGPVVGGIGLATFRLVTAYRLYLRFPHPRTTILASQIIVALIFLNLFVAWRAWF